MLNLINWHWLEDLLVRACEAEIREFGQIHAEEVFFAFCLEYDGLDGSLSFSYATRESVEAAIRAESGVDGAGYRAFELRPENWRYRGHPVFDPDSTPPGTDRIMEQYREAMGEDQDPEVREFLWLRFEYLVECVVQRLIERGAFRYLGREAEFLAYSANEHESLEELEDRLEKLYPNYRRATAEWAEEPRPGEVRPRHCEDGSGCGRRRSRPEARCTCCGAWCCPLCRTLHAHPELARRQPFFRNEP